MTTADPRHFLYRALDPAAAQRLATKHLSRHDDGELYLQYSASEAFGFDDGRLKTADYHSSSGFGLRGVSGETSAFAHANEISEAAIERAAATLKLLDPTRGAPAPPPQRTNQAMYGSEDPLALVPFAEKVALCQKIDAAARARDPRVVQVSVSVSASWSVIDIVRAGGFVASDVRPLVRLGVQIVAEQNGRRETGHHGLGGRYLYGSLFDEAQWGRAIDIALAQALTNLESVAAPAGEMPVVLGPGWP
ncbi:MAG TPA: DNA gyrase modulator, partial [Sphingomicrobium sp.]|nr:DNA gyrase modulator [Sphingomicrobium sp.]